MHIKRKSFTLLLLFLSGTKNALSYEITGNITAEYQYFFDSAFFESQHRDALSLAFNPEINWETDNGKSLFTFIPFFRADQDDDRNHIDIRELVWIYAGDAFETRIGLDKVFWGVAESQHLVDIINQTDFVESIDGEEKLGQPTINFSLANDFGLTNFYILPYFRERTFSSEDGRFYPGVRFHGFDFDNDSPIYESGSEERHIDFALRWAYTFSNSDLAISYFDGTNRIPEFQFSPVDNAVVPVYNQIERLGLEFQYNFDSWIFKFEGILQNGEPEDYFAAVSGFEYTLYGIFESSVDLGLLLEYNYDNRGFDESVNTNSVVFQNDTFLGARFALNNVGSTSFLVGSIFDNDHDGKTWFIEGSTRIGDNFTFTVEARGFHDFPTNTPIAAFREDKFIEAELSWFF